MFSLLVNSITKFQIDLDLGYNYGHSARETNMKGHSDVDVFFYILFSFTYHYLTRNPKGPPRKMLTPTKAAREKH